MTWFQRIRLILLYYAGFCVSYGVGMVETFSQRAADLQNWTYLLTVIYFATRLAGVLGLFTLLPALWLASISSRPAVRAAFLASGICACVLPIWLGFFEGVGRQPIEFALLGVVSACLVSVLLAVLPLGWRSHVA